jgi:hypothetical protein
LHGLYSTLGCRAAQLQPPLGTRQQPTCFLYIMYNMWHTCVLPYRAPGQDHFSRRAVTFRFYERLRDHHPCKHGIYPRLSSSPPESQSGTLGQVQKSRLLGTQNLGISMNPWSLRSLSAPHRERVAGMTLKDLKCTGYARIDRRSQRFTARNPTVLGEPKWNQTPRELITQRSKVELLVKSTSQDFWGPRI